MMRMGVMGMGGMNEMGVSGMNGIWGGMMTNSGGRMDQTDGAGGVTVNASGTDAAETGVGGMGAVWNRRGWNNGCQQNGCRRNRWGDGNERYR